MKHCGARSLLTADYSAQRATVTGESEKAVQYDIMKHEVESNRQIYDAMLQQLKQATIASALRASNARVVDPAKIPQRPYKPNIPLSTGLGLLTGNLFRGRFRYRAGASGSHDTSPGRNSNSAERSGTGNCSRGNRRTPPSSPLCQRGHLGPGGGRGRRRRREFLSSHPDRTHDVAAAALGRRRLPAQRSFPSFSRGKTATVLA